MSSSQSNMLNGKCALVTGAARRIGATIARELHSLGANIAIHYRSSRDDATKLANELNRERPDSASCFEGRLNRIGEATRLLEKVLDWQAQLDILVNNASSFFPTPLGEITEQDWTDLMGSNLKGPIFLCQAAAEALRTSHGTIINIVDIHARRPLRDHVVYGTAKAGLSMLTRTLSKELAPEVRVNGVAPGAIAWPENGMSEATKQSILAQIPLGRSGEPADIARCVSFLVCDATYTTGQVIAIDGGRSVGWPGQS